MQTDRARAGLREAFRWYLLGIADALTSHGWWKTANLVDAINLAVYRTERK